ncbi:MULTISPECIES: DUF7351 domain-containing protein [Salinibaculum]|uniref:DUF7351 domain-containing protein n=1 Tax=Salinibaculum TaxID=2732368 RepID=UPI0030CC7BC3
MTGRGSSTSSLEAAAKSAGADAIQAFAIVGNETRLAILLALWEAYDPYAEDNAVPFSELRRRVSVRDPGQFNYHLGKLAGQFVRKTAGGYELHPTGLHLVQTVIAGTGTKTASIPPTDIGGACLRCGGETALSYQDGWLYYVCTDCEGFFRGGTDEPEGILFSQALPPAALSNRTLEAVFAAAVFRMGQAFAMEMGGICPRCSGVVASTFEICDAHESREGTVCSTCRRQYEVAVRWACTVCKYRGQAPPCVAAIAHPAVTAFYHDHGVDVGYTIDGFEGGQRVLSLLRDHEQTLVATDPPRVLVTIRYEGDDLRLTFDEEMNAVDLEIRE